MAPELILNKQYDYKIDCWSLGVILFELLSGHLPFVSRDTHRLQKQIVKRDISRQIEHDLSDISQEGKHLVQGLLQRNPSQRFSTQ